MSDCATLQQNGNCYASDFNPVYTTLCRLTCGSCILPPPPPSPPAPPSAPPLYGDECYFEEQLNFTYTGAPLQGISSGLGFSEAGHLCLQVPECYAVIENDFYNPSLAHLKRYVLRGAGELLAEPSTTTLLRSRNHCLPPSPPLSPPPPPSSPPPPLYPTLQMQTRPFFFVRFIAQVETTVEQFDVPAYAQRMSTRLGVPSVGVRVSPGSVFVTTEVGADDQAAADALTTQIAEVASDPDLLSELYDAPTTVDTNSITTTQNPDAVMPPPSSPPKRSDEDHSYIALIIILVIALPVGAFLIYLHLEKKGTWSNIAPLSPEATRTPYARVTKDDAPTRKADISFNLTM